MTTPDRIRAELRAFEHGFRYALWAKEQDPDDLPEFARELLGQNPLHGGAPDHSWFDSLLQPKQD